MEYLSQTVRIVPLSLTPALAAIAFAGQQEAAKAWTACRDELHRCMREQARWPNRDSLQKLVKGRFALHSQSAQMVCHAFLANVDTTRQLRQSGRKEIRYPWRDKRFYPVLWPAQAMRLVAGHIQLPMGRGRPALTLPRPDWLTEPAACKLVWNRTGYELHLSVPAQATTQTAGLAAVHATVDLGQIHQCAVSTNTGAALIVSGRGIRAEKRCMNQMHGQIARLQSRCKKGSRRWRKLQRSRNTLARRNERRIRDLRHKGTRQVIDFCAAHQVGQLFIGNPDGVRQRRCGRHHNQRMSQWEYGKDISYLQHKAAIASIASFTGSERGTSSRCPVCGHRHKPKGRVWQCKQCGFTGHRDVVGAANMHPIAFGEAIAFPQRITYLRPGIRKRMQVERMNTARPGSSSRPDTGHAARNRCALLPEGASSTTGFSRAPQGAGLACSYSAEAPRL